MADKDVRTSFEGPRGIRGEAQLEDRGYTPGERVRILLSNGRALEVPHQLLTRRADGALSLHTGDGARVPITGPPTPLPGRVVQHQGEKAMARKDIQSKTVVGLFDHFDQAEAAYQDLLDEGIDRKHISVVRRGEYKINEGEPEDHLEQASKGAAVGASTGAVVGGAAGLLAAFGGIAIPGIGPIIGIGPLIVMLAGAGVGAGVGAAAGGLLGALRHAGVPEEDARMYEEGVRRGGTLLSVHTDEQLADRVAAILRQHKAVDIERRGGAYPAWQHDETAPPFVPDTVTVHAAPGEITVAHPSTPEVVHTGGSEPSPAFHYGSSLAHDERYAGREWSAVESEVQRDWERRQPGTWERFKDAIHHGWEQVRRGGLRHRPA